LKKHAEIDAIIYCQECDKNMCNKCQNLHSELFDSHHIYKLNQNLKEIFTGFCKEKNHNKELNYFCKNHNVLCCAVCLCKIEDKGNGNHKNCEVFLINDIQEEKRKKLKENIKLLEELSIDLNKTINQLKNFMENINENKEKLKIKVQEVFTKIRNEINKREDELLVEIDKHFQKLFMDDNFLKQSEKLPKKINDSLEKGKIIEKEWNINNLPSLINDCLNIENNIRDINILDENIKKIKENQNITMDFCLEDEEIKNILNIIKSFGDIYDNGNFEFKFKEGSNYTLNNNGLIATKTSGGDNWNCTILGNKKIPKNKISKWKIRINNFQIKTNGWNILIGIGPDNVKNESNFYNYCWSFICGNSQLSLKNGNNSKYLDYKKLNKGDIIEVIADRKKGTLSFGVNGKNYGLTNVKIPENEELYPVVLINDQNQTVEIV
jgi:hypothetical protein